MRHAAVRRRAYLGDVEVDYLPLGLSSSPKYEDRGDPELNSKVKLRDDLL